MFLFARNPSWLSCWIWCFSPYAENINFRVLVKNLYIAFARATSLCFVSCEGFPFLYDSMVRFVFHVNGICCCL